MTEPTRSGTLLAELPSGFELEPTPVEGCADCTKLAAERADARDRRDMSRVADCNVLLKRHAGGHS
jgi:hypothetical protein